MKLFFTEEQLGPMTRLAQKRLAQKRLEQKRLEQLAQKRLGRHHWLELGPKELVERLVQLEEHEP